MMMQLGFTILRPIFRWRCDLAKRLYWQSFPIGPWPLDAWLSGRGARRRKQSLQGAREIDQAASLMFALVYATVYAASFAEITPRQKR